MSLAWMVALVVVSADGPKPATAQTPTAPGAEPWRLTLTQAIRIGVKNSEAVRVAEDGDAIQVARLPSAGPDGSFRSAMMAHVRSIEQQYWALSQQQVQLWSREMAVRLFEEILARERSDPYGHNTADVAEAAQALEQAKLALIAAASDTITTERQLRNILGLPPVDGRRIVAVTPPLEAKYEPDWKESLAAMMAHQPDILHQREAVVAAERRESTAADSAKSAAPAGVPAAVAAVFETHQRKVSTDRQRAFLKQVVHQSTHSLARFTLEVDANYKQFQVAKRLREATQIRLESARTYYEKGRTGFTIDRLLEAVSQYSDAIAQEAQYKTSYNTSIAALDEAKGTLLAERKIAVVEPKAGEMTSPHRVVKDLRRGVTGVDFDFKPASFTAPPAPDGPKPDARPPSTAPAGRVIRYDVSLEGGPVPIQLKGTVSIGTPAGH